MSLGSDSKDMFNFRLDFLEAKLIRNKSDDENYGDAKLCGQSLCFSVFLFFDTISFFGILPRTLDRSFC